MPKGLVPENDGAEGGGNLLSRAQKREESRQQRLSPEGWVQEGSVHAQAKADNKELPARTLSETDTQVTALLVGAGDLLAEQRRELALEARKQGLKSPVLTQKHTELPQEKKKSFWKWLLGD